MYEFIEILDFCGYDLDAAIGLAKTMGPDVRRSGLKADLSEAKHVC